MNKNIQLVYILGTSFSGSTLLGYIAGCSPKVDNVGELKFFNRAQIIKDFTCPCGCNILKCPFWKEVYKKKYDIFEVPGIAHKCKIALSIIFKKSLLKQKNINDDYYLLFDLHKKLSQLNSKNVYILDTSKSLWRLIHLMNLKALSVKVIYIKRDIEGNVASFIRHGFGFFRGILTYLLNNWLIERFLKNYKVNALRVNYKEMCINPTNTLKALGRFLDTDYTNYVSQMKKTNYHVQVGNLATQAQFLKGFEGVKYDDRWKTILNNFEKKAVKLFS